MRRPILIITIGFIIGNILGLYFNIAPFIFIIAILLILFLKSINLKCNRIVKIFLKNNIVLLFLISAFISSIYLSYYNKRFEVFYNNFNNTKILATVVSNNKETEYMNTYKIKLDGYKNIYLILRISKYKEIKIEYGDKIEITGAYILPDVSRNYGGFNYRQYLKTQDVYGIYDADKVEILDNNNLGFIELFSNKIKLKIIENINKILPKSTSQLFLGILIGYDDNLSEDIEESFRKSSLTHLLAVSGAHIAYIVVAFSFLSSKLKIPKRTANIITILFLIFFMYITDFSASVVRASIMGIIYLFSIVFFRKNDFQNTMSISILIILIDNPYKLLDIGLILSYFATVGIICFSKFQQDKKEEVKIITKQCIKEKIIEYVKELGLITIFANVFVLPIMIYNFNTISFIFIISNLIAGILIGPITIGGFILIIISFINLKIAYIIGIPYNILLKLLIKSTEFTSLIPLSEILVFTPNLITVITYYLILFLCLLYIFLSKKYSNRYLVNKISCFIQNIYYLIKQKYKKFISFFIIFILIFNFVSLIILQNLKIYFIDVGQGDSTLVITPTNKKILIDSGGSETGSFDVGKSTLLPYLLDRKIKSLDYICISHFDSDHCQGFIYLLNNIKIKNIIISKQYELTNNFKEIMSIVNRKNINILQVEAGDILKIDNDIRFNILSPGKELSNDINDNSIVMKLEYNNFSCLFTGDISKQIEQNLVNRYGEQLKSTILKIAHHGSRTSSDENFIKVVNPKISLIGVGKNNKFGHPTEEVIKSLKDINSKIYRTDKDGGIEIIINKSGTVKVNKRLHEK